MHPTTGGRHSFVVLAHGHSPYIEDCLQSLFSQTVPSKIIIATSTPTEHLQSLAEKHGITYRIINKSSCIADDWNYALQIPDEQYITLAHQDDLYHSDYTASIIAAMGEEADTLISFSDYSIIRNDTLHKWTTLLLVKRVILAMFFLFTNRIRNQAIRRICLSLGNPICCPTVTFDKSKIAHLKFDPTYRVNLDWKYWIDLTHLEGSFIYVKKRLLDYRSHPETTTRHAILSGMRENEDRRCYELLWPRPISSMLSWLYTLSYRIK